MLKDIWNDGSVSVLKKTPKVQGNKQMLKEIDFFGNAQKTVDV